MSSDGRPGIWTRPIAQRPAIAPRFAIEPARFVNRAALAEVPKLFTVSVAYGLRVGATRCALISVIKYSGAQHARYLVISCPAATRPAKYCAHDKVSPYTVPDAEPVVTR